MADAVLSKPVRVPLHVVPGATAVQLSILILLVPSGILRQLGAEKMRTCTSLQATNTKLKGAQYDSQSFLTCSSLQGMVSVVKHGSR